MQPILIKKQLHSAFVEAFRELEHPDDEKPIFGSVEKLYIDFPKKVPACEIAVSAPSIEVMGLDYDTRNYNFSSIVSDFMESNVSEDDAVRKIDRLSDIEDVILEYLEAIPNNAEDFVANAKVQRLSVSGARYGYEMTEKGMRIYQVIDFTASVLIDVKQ